MAFTRLHELEGRGAVLITTASLAPSVALLLGLGDQHSLAAMVPATALVSYALVLGAGVLTYFHWRTISIGRGDELSIRLAAWLTVGLTAGAINGLLQAAPLDDGSALDTDRWAMVAQLVLLLLLAAVAAVAERVDLRLDPAVVGGAVAALITAGYCLAIRIAPPLVLTDDVAALLNTAIMVSALGLAWILLNRTQVSLWARRRLAVGAVLTTGAQCATNLDADHAVLMAAAMAAFLMGALTLCAMTQQLLRKSILAHQQEMDSLHRTLADARAAVLEERELLHEVGSTLAGINTASQVMRHGQAVPAHRRERLETMLSSELARLERLMLARAGGSDYDEDREIELDEVVEAIVTSHQARGRDVWWNPSGERAFGQADELSEMINILLENAARHGGAGTVRLSVSAQDDGILVICADSGAGVAPELRDRLFEREVRRSDSPGQGLGLAIAHRLATARGGSLELADHDRPGATFVARLPRKVTADVHHHVA